MSAGLSVSTFRRRCELSALVRPMRKLLHFKAAVVFDHRVEDPLHEVRIDQVAFGLNDFLLHG